MKKLVPFFIFIALVFSVSAQIDPPLVGPLLALNTVEQDAVLIYDVGSDSLRRIELGHEAHHVWDFSPDGCRILLTLREGTAFARLVSVDLRGNQARDMVAYAELPPERWGIWEPDWSPDGSLIAFTMARLQTLRNGETELQHHIAYVTLDNPEPQFYSVTGREFSPRWSPSGVWLAYVSYAERAAGANPLATAIPTAEPPPGQTPPAPTLVSEADIWIVSADAETKYPLTDFDVGSAYNPRWSPDSELVSFVWSPSNNNDMVWMIGNRPNAIPTQLSYEWSLILDQVWLPDGTGIISAMRDFRGMSENRLWQIPLVNDRSDEGAKAYLAEAAIPHADYPRFSPDGNVLAVRSAYELLLVDLISGETRFLDVSTISNSPPVWSPSGFAGEASCSG